MVTQSRFNKQEALYCSRVKNVGSINNTFNVHHIFFHIRSIIEYGQLCKLWEVVQNILVGLRTLEGRVVMIRLEGMPDVSPVSLVNQNEGDLVIKRRLQKRVILSLRENNTQGEVGIVTSSVPIQVSFDTRLVTCLCCEERRASYGSCILFAL